MEASQKGTVESQLFVMWIIWGAMVGSLIIYIVVCHLIGDQIQQPIGPEYPLTLLRNILFGISLVSLIVTHFIRNFLLRTPSGSPGIVSKTQPSANEPANSHAKYTTAMIISLALCESVGIYGLILFFLGDGLQTMYTFMVISAAGMFYYRPKREELEELSREY
jgi:F0F1-type ATP synthase membrane subunit c/vacuolar-type H+-ATPase subunit K